MKHFKLLKAFEKDESGAVTVDWVVLTAAIVGLGIVIVATVRLGSQDLADQIAAAIGSISPGDPGCAHPHMHGSVPAC